MARIGLFVLGQFCQLLVWMYLGPWLGATLPQSTQSLIAIAVGALAGVTIALLAHWTRKPLLDYPGWELTFRIVAWLGLLTWGVLEARYRNTLIGGGVICAVIAAGGPALAGHCADALRRLPRLRLTRRPRPASGVSH